MVDLSVLKNFEPVSLSSTKDSSGDGITFESELNPFLKSDSLDADKLAKKIQQEAEKLKADKAKQLELIERSLAYVRAKGGSDLSSEVYEQLKNKDSSEFIDVFGKSDKVPTNVENSTSAKVAWGQIMTGAAYDHIEKNKESIEKSLGKASPVEGDQNILGTNNKALMELKKELMENNTSLKAAADADADITKMLRAKGLLTEKQSVKIEINSSEDTTKELEALRKNLTKKIDQAQTPEEARQILEKSVDEFEKLRPRDNDEPEVFYAQQMQEVLNKSNKYKDYKVAAIPSLEKIKVDGKELITTSNEKVFVNSDGKFVVKEDDDYNIRNPKNGNIKVGDETINIKDIKPSKPEISVFMDKDSKTVEDESLKVSRQYCEDQRLVYEASGNEKALKELDKVDRVLDARDEALKERRKKEEKEGKSDNNDTLASIMGIIAGIATIVAALSLGGGRNTTITGGGGYSGQGGQNGYGYGSYPVSDKYGYNRGYQATVDAAYERSNQYLSTFYNNPVRIRARILSERGQNAITGKDGGPGVYGYINPTRY
jgi:hypothetical protein